MAKLPKKTKVRRLKKYVPANRREMVFLIDAAREVALRKLAYAAANPGPYLKDKDREAYLKEQREELLRAQGMLAITQELGRAWLETDILDGSLAGGKLEKDDDGQWYVVANSGKYICGGLTSDLAHEYRKLKLEFGLKNNQRFPEVRE